MAFSVETHVAALFAQRQMGRSSSSLGHSFRRLATGLRMEDFPEDGEEVSIETGSEVRTRVLNQAIRSANDGISLAQVAERALERTMGVLGRIQQLLKPDPDSPPVEQEEMAREISRLVLEVDRIAQGTVFDGMSLLTGSVQGQGYQVGVGSSQTLTITIEPAGAEAIGLGRLEEGLEKEGSEGVPEVVVNEAMASVSGIRATLEEVLDRFEAAAGNLNTLSENMEASRSRIIDVDVAEETSAMARDAILLQADRAVLAQANHHPQLVLTLLD
ncbi:MAG: flagellin FliC [Magnetococcales bacterium]|nr:flagellin FliC [Magnetococcales bacterium]